MMKRKRKMIIGVVLTFFLCIGLQSAENDLYYTNSNLDFPYTPEDTIVYEAEEGSWSNALVENKYEGFSGSGYVNTENTVGSWLEFGINVPEDVIARCTWYYTTTGFYDRPGMVSVDGVDTNIVLTFPGTWYWSNWKRSRAVLKLGAGDHTIRLTATTGLGLASIDKLTLSYVPSTGSETTPGPDAIGFPGLTYPAVPGEEPEPSSLYFHYNNNNSSRAIEYAKYQVSNPYGNPDPDSVNPLDFLQHEEFGVYQTERCGPFNVGMGLREAYYPGTDYYKEYKLGISVASPFISSRERKPVVLTMVVDVSSEMRRNAPRVDENSLSRLKLVQYGLMKLADSLKPGDIINLVTFKGEAWVVCRGLVFERDENTYLSAVANLEPAGYADIAPALATGYEIAQETYDSHKINSLILITSQDEENPEIDNEVIEGYTEYGGSEGITLSCLGIGTPGDESYLKSLAQAGKGTYFTAQTKTDMIRTFGDRFYAIVKPAFKNVRFRLDFPPEMLCDVPADGDVPGTNEDCEPDDFSYNTKTYFFQGFKTLSHLNIFNAFFTLTISYTDAKTGIDNEVVYKKPVYTILGRDSKALREAECVLLFTELYAGRKNWADLKPRYDGLSTMYYNSYYNYSHIFNEYTYLFQLARGEKLTINPKRLDFGYSLLQEEQIQTINLTSTLSLSDIMITRADIVYPDVLGFGYNSYGAMGIGTQESYSILGPTGVEIDDVKSITSARLKSFFLKNDGTLWACGENKNGSLGIGSIDDIALVPRQVKINNVAAVSPSENHTLFLKTDGSLWACGENRFGQMGSAIEPGTLSLVPVKMVDSGVVAISAGLENSFYIMEDGSLWATGANQAGQLGTGDTIHRYQPEKVVDSGVISVAAGETHTLILKTGNSLWGCGDNYYCALGPVPEQQHPDFIELFPEGIKEIAAGSSYSLILKNDGSLWRVGRNTGRNVVTYYYYYGYYYSYFPDWQCICSSGVVSMKAGSTHCMFMKEDGSLWGQGRNRSSELITGKSGYLFEPTQIYASGIRDFAPGYHFSLVLREPSPDIFNNYRGHMFMLKAPGEEELIDIGFTPPEEGLYNASLIIETNLPGKYRQVIPLNGIGTETLPTPTPEPTGTPEPTATPESTATPDPTPEVTPKPTPTPLPWTGDIRFDPKITTVSLDTTSFQTSLVLDLPADTLGAYGYDIYYDPAVVYVSESEDSEWILAGADVSTLIARGDEPGVIRLAGFEAFPIGPGTDFEICIVNWHPLAVGTTELKIIVNDMVNENYQPFGVSEVKSAGTIVITEP